VKNAEKMLSLYEEHAAVYVRGKAGAEVEFGSQLLLGEAESGVIVDWELVRGNPRADTKMLSRSLERMKQMSAGASIKQVSSDRGFDSEPNRALLKQDGIYNGRHERDGALADFLERQFKAAKLLRAQLLEHSFHLSCMLSEGRNNEVSAL
jgi:hypothetical protein